MGSLLSSPSPPAPAPDTPNSRDPRLRAIQRQQLEELKRRRGRRATILTDGLRREAEGMVSESEAERIRSLAARFGTADVSTADTAGQTKPQQPQSDQPQPEKPSKPEKPKPERPEENGPDPCLIQRLEVREENERVMEVRRKQQPVQKQIDDLKDEIAALRRQQDLETAPTVERPPGGPGGGGSGSTGGRVKRILRIGGKAFPYVTGILTAKGIIDSVNRSQMIAAAEQWLAELERELKDLEEEEKQRERDYAAALRKLERCEADNKRQ